MAEGGRDRLDGREGDARSDLWGEPREEDSDIEGELGISGGERRWGREGLRVGLGGGGVEVSADDDMAVGSMYDRPGLGC